MTLRVLVADDQEIVRTGLAMILGAQDGIEVVATAVDGQDAVEQARDLRPDVCLLDIRMPRLNGIEATRQIVEQLPGTTVFLCSTYQRADLPPEAETSGFAAYVNKEELGPDLLRRLWDERPSSG